ncbi:MAG: divergent polysaccharide deacetylase family protein [Firmicutes bacterium]|nr:divergent polysaccharide deacetylase family protein [Bacillota bacterium]
MIIIFSTKKRLFLYAAVIILFIVSFQIAKGFNRRSITVSSSEKYIALVIDDFGNNSAGTKEMVSLPIKFTGAVMPSMPYTQEECELLHENGKDVILHQPMEARNGKKEWLGSSAIMDSDEAQEAEDKLLYNISQIKYCSGVNNHMGSKVSRNAKIMDGIFKGLKEKGLPYVDSMTTPDSVAEKMGERHGVTVIKRDIFLDSTQDISKIEQNIMKAADIALKNGYCLAIGHVGAEGGRVTYRAIKNKYEEIEAKNIKFVTVGELEAILKQ